MADDQRDNDPSVNTFTSALWFNAALAGGFFAAFVILRRHRSRVYSPRSKLVEKERQPPPLPNRFLLWIIQLFQTPDDELIRSMGLDRYMILRYLRMGMVVFTIFSFFALPILIPLNIIGQRDSPGLNKLTMGNVSDTNRLWAHLILAVLLSAGVVYMSYRETRRYLHLRRTYLLSPDYASTVTARTLYVPGIPNSVNNVDKLAQIFNRFPGGVRRIWITRNMKSLPDSVADRLKYVQGLEGAITTAILDTYKHIAKKGESIEEGQTITEIPTQLRPKHRVSSLPIPLPCIGRKVDSIAYYSNEIQVLNDKILLSQKTPRDLHKLSSAFIEFNQQIAAHMAAQCVVHARELQMAPRYIQVSPTDVIWENMNISNISRIIRRGLSYTITGVIVIFWAIPVAFVQAVANIQTLSKVLPFLAPLNTLPPTAIGIIQGILPAVALAILVALVPIIFTKLSTYEGIPQKSHVSLAVLDKYFAFLFVDVVLVSTIAGGVLTTLQPLLENPISVINILSENLPKASVFFITYVMLQALNGCSQSMAQAVPLVLSYIFPFLAKTPRQIRTQRSKCPNVEIGTLVPTFTVVFVLGLEYSVIAPLILPFVCLFFYLSYFVYLYQFLYVYEMEFETGGLAFPRSIRHIYIGMFTWQLTMIGLFAVQDGAIGQMIIMIITLVACVFALALYDKAFKPMFKFLPIQEEDTEISGLLTSDPIPALSKRKSDDKRVLTEIDQDEISSLPSQDDNSVHRRKNPSSVRNYGAVSSTVGELDAYRLREEGWVKIRDELEHAGSTSEVQLANSPYIRTLYESETYMHPALYQTQPTVWLPKDSLGIAEAEMNRLRRLNILASCYGARVDKVKSKGKVVIEEDKVLYDNKGIPGEAPGPDDLPRINDFTRNVVDNYNVIEAMTLSI